MTGSMGTVKKPVETVSQCQPLSCFEEKDATYRMAPILHQELLLDTWQGRASYKQKLVLKLALLNH